MCERLRVQLRSKVHSESLKTTSHPRQPSAPKDNHGSRQECRGTRTHMQTYLDPHLESVFESMCVRVASSAAEGPQGKPHPSGCLPPLELFT